MKVLAINQNATIERLVNLSSGKMGYTLRHFPDVMSAEHDDYNFILIDSEIFAIEDYEALKDISPNALLILICSKNIQKPEGFDIYLEKPFLPTELVDIYTREQNRFMQPAVEPEQEEDDVIEEAMPSFDEDAGLEELPSFDDGSEVEQISFDDEEAIDGHDENEFTFNLDSVMNSEPEESDISADDGFNFENEEESNEFNFESDDLLSKLDESSSELPELSSGEEFDFAIEHPDLADNAFDDSLSLEDDFEPVDILSNNFESATNDLTVDDVNLDLEDDSFNPDDLLSQFDEESALADVAQESDIPDFSNYETNDLELDDANLDLEDDSFNPQDLLENEGLEEDLAPSVLGEDDALEIKSLLNEDELSLDEQEDIDLPELEEDLTLDDTVEELPADDILEDVAPLEEQVEEELTEESNDFGSDLDTIDNIDMLSANAIASALGVNISSQDGEANQELPLETKKENIASEVAQKTSESFEFSKSENIDKLISVLKDALMQDNVTINFTITKN